MQLFKLPSALSGGSPDPARSEPLWVENDSHLGRDPLATGSCQQSPPIPSRLWVRLRPGPLKTCLLGSFKQKNQDDALGQHYQAPVLPPKLAEPARPALSPSTWGGGWAPLDRLGIPARQQAKPPTCQQPHVTPEGRGPARGRSPGRQGVWASPGPRCPSELLRFSSSVYPTLFP